jgi:LacI family transcriptional regulator
MIDDGTSPGANGKRGWRSPTIAEIARAAGVGTATVDRVLNGRSSVREATRKKVQAALDRLAKPDAAAATRPWRIAFLSDSGVSFAETLRTAVEEMAQARPDAIYPFTAVATSQVDPVKFANLIERTAEQSDALIVVAREDLTINRAIRNVVARRIPVICLTTDLPNSGRAAYVGNDQAGAGATAAYLMGQVVGNRSGKILLVYSAPYRGQEERELGFRRVLRSEFPLLEVDERVNSNDETEVVFCNVMRYIEDHGAPAGIYNTAGGNIGIGRALEESGLAGKTVFIGHELNANSRMLLEAGVMHFAIGHDVGAEVAQAIDVAIAQIEKRSLVPPPPTRVRIYTKYSCN